MTYKDIRGWFSFEPFYNHISETFLKDGMRIVEVGCFHGKSTAFMAGRIKEKNLGVEFYAVDSWLPITEHVVLRLNSGPYEIFCNNMTACDVSDFVEPIKADSVAASQKFPDGFFDFVFIDADHKYKAVKADIQAWLPKVKAGGIIGGDDYVDGWPGVVQAVNEAFGDRVRKDFLQAWFVPL